MNDGGDVTTIGLVILSQLHTADFKASSGPISFMNDTQLWTLSLHLFSVVCLPACVLGWSRQWF